MSQTGKKEGGWKEEETTSGRNERDQRGEEQQLCIEYCFQKSLFFLIPNKAFYNYFSQNKILLVQKCFPSELGLLEG